MIRYCLTYLAILVLLFCTNCSNNNIEPTPKLDLEFTQPTGEQINVLKDSSFIVSFSSISEEGFSTLKITRTLPSGRVLNVNNLNGYFYNDLSEIVFPDSTFNLNFSASFSTLASAGESEMIFFRLKDKSGALGERSFNIVVQ